MTIKQELKEIILASDDEWTVKELVKATGYKRESVYSAIDRLVSEGVIVRVKSEYTSVYSRNQTLIDHEIKLTIINNPGKSFDALLKLTRTTAPDLYRIMSELNIAPDLKPADCVG